jgi:hypothetical protein
MLDWIKNTVKSGTFCVRSDEEAEAVEEEEDEIAIDSCTEDTDCENGGTCATWRSNSSGEKVNTFCSCEAGFSGDHCEIADIRPSAEDGS